MLALTIAHAQTLEVYNANCEELELDIDILFTDGNTCAGVNAYTGYTMAAATSTAPTSAFLPFSTTPPMPGFTFSNISITYRTCGGTITGTLYGIYAFGPCPNSPSTDNFSTTCGGTDSWCHENPERTIDFEYDDGNQAYRFHYH